MKGSDGLKRKLIIDENTIYELDEACMLTKRVHDPQSKPPNMKNEKREEEKIGENGQNYCAKYIKNR